MSKLDVEKIVRAAVAESMPKRGASLQLSPNVTLGAIGFGQEEIQILKHQLFDIVNRHKKEGDFRQFSEALELTPASTLQTVIDHFPNASAIKVSGDADDNSIGLVAMMIPERFRRHEFGKTHFDAGLAGNDDTPGKGLAGKDDTTGKGKGD